MKKLVGAAVLVAGVAVVVAATRNQWFPLLKAGVQETLIWALDDPDDDEDEPEGLDAWRKKEEEGTDG